MNIDDKTNENEEMNAETEHTENTEAKNEKSEEKDYKKEYEDLHERYIRLAADFDNYKKRTAKEKSDISVYGNEELIKSILDVVDNLERALEHADSNEDSGSLIEGVKLVHSQLLNCLQRFGLEKISADKGTEFDPRYHQAFERVETDELSSGLILSEMVKGYKLKDRLLRPAVVSVSAEPVPQNRSSGTETNSSGTGEEEADSEQSRYEQENEGYIDLTDEDTTE